MSLLLRPDTHHGIDELDTIYLQGEISHQLYYSGSRGAYAMLRALGAQIDSEGFSSVSYDELREWENFKGDWPDHPLIDGLRTIVRFAVIHGAGIVVV